MRGRECVNCGGLGDAGGLVFIWMYTPLKGTAKRSGFFIARGVRWEMRAMWGLESVEWECEERYVYERISVGVY